MRKFNEFSDTELVLSFQEGNSGALEALICRYKEKYLAEDLFQETFVRIIDTLRSKRYNEEGKFLPWAMRIAHNLCVDYFRKVKRTPTIKNSEDQDIFEVLNFTEDSAETKMIKRQSYSRVKDMLDLLPEDQREVIILRHYGDMSFKEI